MWCVRCPVEWFHHTPLLSWKHSVAQAMCSHCCDGARALNRNGRPHPGSCYSWASKPASCPSGAIEIIHARERGDLHRSWADGAWVAHGSSSDGAGMVHGSGSGWEQGWSTGGFTKQPRPRPSARPTPQRQPRSGGLRSGWVPPRISRARAASPSCDKFDKYDKLGKFSKFDTCCPEYQNAGCITLV